MYVTDDTRGNFLLPAKAKPEEPYPERELQERKPSTRSHNKPQCLFPLRTLNKLKDVQMSQI